MNNEMMLLEGNVLNEEIFLSPYFWVGAVFLVLMIMTPWVLLIFLWIFKRYRVRFFGFHGEVLSVKYYKKNSLFDLPTNTDIPGYTFDGWYEDPEFEYPMSISYVSESNLKFYGKWIKIDEEV